MTTKPLAESCVLGIDYDEGNVDSYRGVTVGWMQMGMWRTRRFDTGDFGKDMEAAQLLVTTQFEVGIMSSSFDTWLADLQTALAVPTSEQEEEIDKVGEKPCPGNG